jgi:hypothetical protein
MKALLGIVLLGAVLMLGAPSASADGATGKGNCLDQSTLATALQTLMPDPSQPWAEKVRARCSYRCKCHFRNRRKVPCRWTVFLDCPGRVCGRCLGRAKVRARAKCRRRGPVRSCFCPFKRLRLKP